MIQSSDVVGISFVGDIGLFSCSSTSMSVFLFLLAVHEDIFFFEKFRWGCTPAFRQLGGIGLFFFAIGLLYVSR